MKHYHFNTIGIILCLSFIPMLFSCSNDDPEVYDNVLIINGQKYDPIISSVTGADDDLLTVKLFTPYDDSFSGTLSILKPAIGQTLDLSKDKDRVTLSYEQKGNTQTDLHLESGNMAVKKEYRYGIRIEAKDVNGERFYLCIVPDGLKRRDDGQWTAW